MVIESMIPKREEKWVLIIDIALFFILVFAIIFALYGVDVKPVRIFFETYLSPIWVRYTFAGLGLFVILIEILIGKRNREKYGDILDLFMEAFGVLFFLHIIYVGGG